MRTLVLVWLVVSIGLTEALAQNYGSKGNPEEIRRVVEGASFEFTNAKMYLNQNDWIGKAVAFQASFSSRPDLLKTDQPYEQVSGRSADGDPINLLVFYDNPVIVPKNSWEGGPTVSRADQVYVFGIVQKCKEVVTRSGIVRVVPTLDLLLLFRLDDQAFRDPIWVSKSLQH
jgi:hypothetical protein